MKIDYNDLFVFDEDELKSIYRASFKERKFVEKTSKCSSNIDKNCIIKIPQKCLKRLMVPNKDISYLISRKL